MLVESGFKEQTADFLGRHPGVIFVVVCALVGGTLAGTVAGVGEFFDEYFTPAPNTFSAFIEGLVPGAILGGFFGVLLALLGKRYFGR